MMSIYIMIEPLFLPRSFQWDDGNRRKNKEKHDVSIQECEQVFSNQPLILLDDPRHSIQEPRWFALGRTPTDRQLSLVFTIRHDQIRIISARDMSKRERSIYAKN